MTIDSSNVVRKNGQYQGSTLKDTKINMSGFKYPDRIYGPKFNSVNRQGDRTNEPSALNPKMVNKPIHYGNMHSLNYHNPTIVTRQYQYHEPPNIIDNHTQSI